MGIERRSGSSGRYLYRAERDGDQVLRHYVGPLRDPVVAVLACFDRLTLAERKALQVASREEQGRYLEADRLVDQLEAVAKRLDQACRLAAGKVRRHQNSRRRERTMRNYDNAREQE